ncbi:MAG: sigma-54-dependent Fis family transcriptional regulator, partial [Magnetococcales bacterium]|nr:sigma-54-dependent Fis family transcriptional regulator [Magnetococcales bacterium]
MPETVLIVDDEASIRSSLRGILEDEHYVVEEASSGEEALRVLSGRVVSAILLDIWMQGMDGIETLKRIKGGVDAGGVDAGGWDAGIPVVMMSGHGTIETAVLATREGAYDFLEKPLSLDRVLLLLSRAIREWNLVRENRALKQRVEEAPAFLGKSRAVQELEAQIGRVAPTEGWVLVNGENGTGKEVAARRIHQLSSRREGPFVAVNSAAIPENEIETELFGWEKIVGGKVTFQ